MTAQISDKFRYRGKSYTLVAINGSGLFDPAPHGITPVPISTACWRGYHCTYEVKGGELHLTEVHLGLGKEDEAAAARGEGPLLFGKVPHRYTEYGGRTNLHTGEVTTSWESPDFKIDGVWEPIPFTGGLLFGENFDYKTILMVFHPAVAWNTIHELVFGSGRLIEDHDRSAQMAEFREMLSSMPLISRFAAQPISRREDPESQALRAEIKKRINGCFSLEYNDWPYYGT